VVGGDIRDRRGAFSSGYAGDALFAAADVGVAEREKKKTCCPRRLAEPTAGSHLHEACSPPPPIWRNGEKRKRGKSGHLQMKLLAAEEQREKRTAPFSTSAAIFTGRHSFGHTGSQGWKGGGGKKEREKKEEEENIYIRRRGCEPRMPKLSDLYQLSVDWEEKENHGEKEGGRMRRRSPAWGERRKAPSKPAQISPYRLSFSNTKKEGEKKGGIGTTPRSI